MAVIDSTISLLTQNYRLSDSVGLRIPLYYRFLERNFLHAISLRVAQIIFNIRHYRYYCHYRYYFDISHCKYYKSLSLVYVSS